MGGEGLAGRREELGADESEFCGWRREKKKRKMGCGWVGCYTATHLANKNESVMGKEEATRTRRRSK